MIDLRSFKTEESSAEATKATADAVQAFLNQSGTVLKALRITQPHPLNSW